MQTTLPATSNAANQQLPRHREGDLTRECLDYAASSPDEVCGLIIDDHQLFPCRNIHPQPNLRFRISDADWLAAEEMGEVTAIFHSHPIDMPYLSSADRKAQVASGLPWWLACNGVLRKFRPVPYLLGRRFEYGVADCYTLFRDAYHLAGIELPVVEHTAGWWLLGENLYLKNADANGFYQIEPSEVMPGDIIMRQAFRGADASHAMIQLAGGLVLHHDHNGSSSRREPMRQAFIKQLHSTWRHRDCSSLNLAALYEDFSAKSL